MGFAAVRNRLFGAHRRLLFRSYLILVAGLLAVAIVLNIAFSRFQSTTAADEDPWVESTLRLVEAQLAGEPVDRLDAIAAELSERIGMPVRLIASDDVALGESGTPTTGSYVDADGDTVYLYESPSLGGLISLGPVAPPENPVLLKLLPPIFYLSIFVLVGVWLRPLLRDIDLISAAARRFATDYREPTEVAERTTTLTNLAEHVDGMSVRLSGLIQSQKELIAALSHEMRTPLARIRFALAVLAPESGKDVQPRLRALNDDVQEIDDLIATMLDYARLDHPDLRMSRQDVPVSAWLSEVVERYSELDKQIDVVDASAPELANMDRRLMTLAANNLLSNAVRYGNERIRLSILESPEGYELRVEDDGDGVPERERDTVFKAFTRLDDSRTRETGGYGLGLAIVARIAALHGGTTSVTESADLGGARFSLTWPRRTGLDSA